MAKVLYALIENPCTTDGPEKVTIRVMTEITRSSYPICHSLSPSSFYRLYTHTHTQHTHNLLRADESQESSRRMCTCNANTRRSCGVGRVARDIFNQVLPDPMPNPIDGKLSCTYMVYTLAFVCQLQLS